MVRPDEINTVINELTKSRYNMPTINRDEIAFVRPPVDDLYEKAALRRTYNHC